MEGWRQRRLGLKAKPLTGKEENKNHLDTNRPSHGRTLEPLQSVVGLTRVLSRPVRPLILECPSCHTTLKSSMLRAEFGSRKGHVICPSCNRTLRYSPPYHMITLWGSSPIFIYFLLTRGIREGWLSSVRMLLAWFVGSIVVSAYISRIKPPILKLSDDDGPIRLFKRADK